MCGAADLDPMLASEHLVCRAPTAAAWDDGPKTEAVCSVPVSETKPLRSSGFLMTATQPSILVISWNL